MHIHKCIHIDMCIHAHIYIYSHTHMYTYLHAHTFDMHMHTQPQIPCSQQQQRVLYVLDAALIHIHLLKFICTHMHTSVVCICLLSCKSCAFSKNDLYPIALHRVLIYIGTHIYIHTHTYTQTLSVHTNPHIHIHLSMHTLMHIHTHTSVICMYTHTCKSRAFSEKALYRIACMGLRSAALSPPATFPAAKFAKAPGPGGHVCVYMYVCTCMCVHVVMYVCTCEVMTRLLRCDAV